MRSDLFKGLLAVVLTAASLRPAVAQSSPALQQAAALKAKYDYSGAVKVLRDALAPLPPAFTPDRVALTEALIDVLASGERDVAASSAVLTPYCRWASGRLLGHPTVQLISVIHQCAYLYSSVGDYGHAQDLLLAAWTALSRVPEPKENARVLIAAQIVELYTNLNDFRGAELFLDQTKTTNPQLISQCAHAEFELRLAEADATADFSARYALHGQALDAAAKEIQGAKTDEFWAGQGYEDIARVEQRKSHLEETQRALDKANEIFVRTGNSGLEQVAIEQYAGENLRSLGRAGLAAETFKKAADYAATHLGISSPLATLLSLDQAEALLDLGKKEDALGLIAAADRGQKAILGQIFSFSSEQQRLNYIGKLVAMKRFAFFDYISADAPELLATAVLQYKGIVLDSMIEDGKRAASLLRSKKDPELARAVAQLKQREAERERAAKRDDEQGRQIADVAIDALEAQIARKTRAVHPEQREVSWQTVQKQLPPDAVLIEFLHYTRYLSQGSYANGYGAVIIPSQGKPSWRDLGTEAAVQVLIETYTSYVRGNQREDEAQELLRHIYDRLWAPCEELFPKNTKTVVISPDDQLSFISFGTLLNEQTEFLGEKYNLKYVSSGRDLLHSRPHSGKDRVVMMGAPDFQQKLPGPANPGEVGASRQAGSDLRGVSFQPLPGTALECKKINSLLQSNPDRHLYLGAAASKRNLMRETELSPRFLHLATHGFFFPPHSTDTLAPGSAARAMDSSGLALSGARITLGHDASGRQVFIGNAGILTASEVAGMELSNTFLVVLSACDTGIGAATTGQGIIGLRRAFVQAGAQNLMTTLWPVSDAATADIMTRFYALLKTGKISPSDALSQVQREWFARLKKKGDFAGAVRLAGPFVITTRGSFQSN
jgi:CHAT domain-containing protein